MQNSVQILVDLFEVTHIINTGVAGSLNAALDIGDILISKDVIHHDVDVRVFGYPLGEVPQLGKPIEKTSAFSPNKRAAMKWPNSWMKTAKLKRKIARIIETGQRKKKKKKRESSIGKP